MNQYVINFNTVYNTLYGESTNTASFTLFADTVVERDNTYVFYTGQQVVGNFPKKDVDTFYKIDVPKTDFNEQLFSMLLSNWHALIIQGGSIVNKLIGKFVDGTESTTNDIILTLLISIGRHTRTYKDTNPICPYCFVRFESIKKQNVDFFVCPKCWQSTNRIDNIDSIYLSINRAMDTHRLINQYVLYVNWLFYKEPFDFDAVYIGPHEDIDIEKLIVFLVELNKNTKKIPCYIDAKISDNSRRILQKYLDVK